MTLFLIFVTLLHLFQYTHITNVTRPIRCPFGLNLQKHLFYFKVTKENSQSLELNCHESREKD